MTNSVRYGTIRYEDESNPAKASGSIDGGVGAKIVPNDANTISATVPDLEPCMSTTRAEVTA